MATPSTIQNIQLLDYNANPITPITYLNSIYDQIDESTTLIGKDVFNQWLATIESPSFTGTPTAPTVASSNNSTQLATTAFVRNAITTYGAESIPLADKNTFGKVKIGSGIDVNAGVISVAGTSIATKTTLGVVKIGDNLNITSDGTLSAVGGIGEIPQATESVLGGIKARARNTSTDNTEVKIDTATGILYTPSTSVVIPVASTSSIGGIISNGDASVNSTTGQVSVVSVTANAGTSKAASYKFWQGTAAEYAAISTKDNNTIYYVTD